MRKASFFPPSPKRWAINSCKTASKILRKDVQIIIFRLPSSFFSLFFFFFFKIASLNFIFFDKRNLFSYLLDFMINHFHFNSSSYVSQLFWNLSKMYIKK